MSSEEKIDYLINNYSTLCYNDEYYDTLGSLSSNIDTLEKTVDILISNNDVHNLSQILLEANITENELDDLLFEKGLNEIVSLKKMLKSKI